MVLFVNGCVRDSSRTLDLANEVLKNLPCEVEEVRLYPNGPEGLDADRLKQRDALLASKEYNHPMFCYARQFAAADTIVIATPYWDLAFPTRVRAYLEEISVSGITFKYGENGIPQGLCKAKRLIYVTTSGGPIIKNLGFEYVKALAQSLYGISDIILITAEKLDIWGADIGNIMDEAKKAIPHILNTKK